LVEAIERALGQHDTQPAALDRPDEAMAPMAAIAPSPTAAEALAQLRALLEQSDSELIDWWPRHRPMLRGLLPAPALRAIGQGIEQFDFDAALAALDSAGVTSTPEPLA
jgi:hypothetical protein